jgi:hypothetical protein
MSSFFRFFGKFADFFGPATRTPKNAVFQLQGGGSEAASKAQRRLDELPQSLDRQWSRAFTVVVDVHEHRQPALASSTATSL